MRTLSAAVAGLFSLVAAASADAAPSGLAKSELAPPQVPLEHVHGVVHYYSAHSAAVYSDVHYAPWVRARRHWYERHYQPASVEPFKYYPYYFYTPRYIYTPHYTIKRSHYRRHR